MVIDTSAILCVLLAEPEMRAVNETIESAESCVISAATLVEASIVAEARFGPAGGQMLDLFVSKARIEVVPVDSEQALAARRAYSRFGKGRHPAALNFGDCFSFALAEVRCDQLLFKGSDFARAGLQSIIADSADPAQ